MGYLRYGYIKGVVKNFNSILDVGFGNGAFLSVLPQEYLSGGFDVFQNPCLPKNSVSVSSITDKHWDVVCFFDSLEHIPDLSVVSKLKCNYVVVSLPWCHYFNDEWFLNWKHRKPDEHLHHFNDTSLTKFFNANGYKCIDLCNIEDSIRTPIDNNPNILTGVFKRE